MKKITSILTIAAFFAVNVAGLTSVSAQSTATMPVLYNQNGIAVNTTSNTVLAAGWYYLAPGGAMANQVQYFGNGTFYQPSNGTYGGSVGDPYGTAGVSLNYVLPSMTPSVPNTGAGGTSALTWVTLALSALVAAGGLAYLVTAKHNYTPTALKAQ